MKDKSQTKQYLQQETDKGEMLVKYIKNPYTSERETQHRKNRQSVSICISHRRKQEWPIHCEKNTHVH